MLLIWNLLEAFEWIMKMLKALDHVWCFRLLNTLFPKMVMPMNVDVKIFSLCDYYVLVTWWDIAFVCASICECSWVSVWVGVYGWVCMGGCVWVGVCVGVCVFESVREWMENCNNTFEFFSNFLPIRNDFILEPFPFCPNISLKLFSILPLNWSGQFRTTYQIIFSTRLTSIQLQPHHHNQYMPVEFWRTIFVNSSEYLSYMVTYNLWCQRWCQTLLTLA